MNPPDPNKKPVKSILKKKNKPRPSIQWDEQNLKTNEDEKVPRMKINEPNTPYRRGSTQEEAEAMSNLTGGPNTPTDDVQFSTDKLVLEPPATSTMTAAVAAALGHNRSNSGGEWDDMSDDDGGDGGGGGRGGNLNDGVSEAERIAKQRHFEEHRKQHYQIPGAKSLLSSKKSTVVESDGEDSDDGTSQLTSSAPSSTKSTSTTASMNGRASHNKGALKSSHLSFASATAAASTASTSISISTSTTAAMKTQKQSLPAMEDSGMDADTDSDNESKRSQPPATKQPSYSATASAVAKPMSRFAPPPAFTSPPNNSAFTMSSASSPQQPSI